MADNRIAFLVGSGISYASCAPSVEELTKRVLERPWKGEGNGKFYPVPGEEGDISVGLAAKAQKLIRLVHEQIVEHLYSRNKRTPNYEDYFSCLNQILEDENNINENPLIAKNVEALRSASASLWLETYPHYDNNRFLSLVERTCDLIQFVVFHSLYNLDNPQGMDLFTSAVKEFRKLDIFSLNHDLLIEKQLESHGIEYKDGFGKEDGDRKLFDRSWDQPCSGVRLFKLHGSVDWDLVELEEGVDKYIYAKHQEPPRYPLSVVPKFLTGKNKQIAYSSGLYGELIGQFRRRIRKHDTLFCSGYGWSDTGINIQIGEWLEENESNQIVILHKDKIEDLQNKRFWSFRWNEYEKTNQVIHVPNWLSECTVDDLRTCIRDGKRDGGN